MGETPVEKHHYLTYTNRVSYPTFQFDVEQYRKAYKRKCAAEIASLSAKLGSTKKRKRSRTAPPVCIAVSRGCCFLESMMPRVRKASKPVRRSRHLVRPRGRSAPSKLARIKSSAANRPIDPSDGFGEIGFLRNKCGFLMPSTEETLKTFRLSSQPEGKTLSLQYKSNRYHRALEEVDKMYAGYYDVTPDISNHLLHSQHLSRRDLTNNPNKSHTHFHPNPIFNLSHTNLTPTKPPPHHQIKKPQVLPDLGAQPINHQKLHYDRLQKLDEQESKLSSAMKKKSGTVSEDTASASPDGQTNQSEIKLGKSSSNTLSGNRDSNIINPKKHPKFYLNPDIVYEDLSHRKTNKQILQPIKGSKSLNAKLFANRVNSKNTKREVGRLLKSIEPAALKIKSSDRALQTRVDGTIAVYTREQVDSFYELDEKMINTMKQRRKDNNAVRQCQRIKRLFGPKLLAYSHSELETSLATTTEKQLSRLDVDKTPRKKYLSFEEKKSYLSL